MRRWHRHHTASAHMMAFLTLTYRRLQGIDPERKKEAAEGSSRRSHATDLTQQTLAGEPRDESGRVFQFRTMPRDEFRRAAESPGAACVQRRGEPQVANGATPAGSSGSHRVKTCRSRETVQKNDDCQGRSHSTRLYLSPQRICMSRTQRPESDHPPGSRSCPRGTAQSHF